MNNHWKQRIKQTPVKREFKKHTLGGFQVSMMLSAALFAMIIIFAIKDVLPL